MHASAYSTPRICTFFREQTRHYFAASTYFRGSAVLLWRAFIAGSMSSPAGEGVHRDSGAFFIPPPGLCSIAQFFFSSFFSALPPNLQECCRGSIADELTLQKCLTELLMASSWNVWQIRLLPVDIWCSKNCPTRGCLLTLSPRWVEMWFFFFSGSLCFPPALSWRVAQGGMPLNSAIAIESDCVYARYLPPSAFSPLVWCFFSEAAPRFSSDTRTFHLGIITSPCTNRVWRSGVSAAVQSRLSSVPGAPVKLYLRACVWVLWRILVRSGLKGQWIFLSQRSWHCDQCYCTYKE